jgi:hypothetical protein
MSGLLPPHLDSSSSSLGVGVRKVKGSIRFYLDEAFFSRLRNTQFHIPSNDCLCLFSLSMWMPHQWRMSDCSSRGDSCLVVAPPLFRRSISSLLLLIDYLHYHRFSIPPPQVVTVGAIHSLFQIFPAKPVPRSSPKILPILFGVIFAFINYL